ncbi:hypothetical protein DERF_009833 [Dermatophagoides farinae]|uniref:Uncharacterized protein n=1 Tax=Dermatophagoides farinae TaxID=6954 RepID=A0A922HVW5_DERFA|nr:hypothetical protein DERF_009833 [Dermatophagoides farinae]
MHRISYLKNVSHHRMGKTDDDLSPISLTGMAGRNVAGFSYASNHSHRNRLASSYASIILVPYCMTIVFSKYFPCKSEGGSKSGRPLSATVLFRHRKI